MRKNKRVEVSDVVTLVDNKSYRYKDYLTKFAINSVEAMNFYYSFGQLAKKPYTGWIYKKFYEQYYKYVHTASIKLPLFEIEKLIDSADSISVGPCPCRLILANDNTKVPLWTCIKINRFSDMVQNMQNRSLEAAAKKGINRRPQTPELSNERAKELVRYLSLDCNLIFSLESCMDPYAKNICSCTRNECIELNSRYNFGFDVSPCGPYTPVFNLDVCVGCGACHRRCPVEAIYISQGKAKWDPDKCLGCGNCVESCELSCIELKVEESRVRDWKEPGPIKMLYIRALAAIMFHMFRRYKAQKGDQENLNRRYGTAQPNKYDLIYKEIYEEEIAKKSKESAEEDMPA